MEKTILLLIQLLLVAGLLYVITALILFKIFSKEKLGSPFKNLLGLIIGFITDMLDTWGIGSFATTTTFFKATRFIDNDKKLPGTMSLAHTIPVIVEALFFITAVQVEISTLIPMTTAAILGALLGTRITARWNATLVRKVLGVLLIIAAIIMVVRLITNPGSGVSESIHGLALPWLLAGVIFNFLLGILMTMGLGNYAPELVFFSLAGVNPLIALPVMMLDAAMILVVSARAFLKHGRVEWRGLLGIIIGGILGVIFAAKVVTTINLELFKIITVVIVLYTGGMLLYESFVKSDRNKKGEL